MSGFHLLPDLPFLEADGFRETSPQDPVYNCLAWAAGDTKNWWWPDDDSYWPTGVPREQTLEAFSAAFVSVGYVECADGMIETGYEKIAIYANAQGPQHAAKQLPDGKWSSKLGRFEDVEHHTPAGVNCETYGSTVKWMKRPKP